MTYQEVKLPQFPETPVFVSLFTGVSEDTLNTIKTELVAANKDYDFCFLNTNHVISLEHLYHSLYKSVLNHKNGTMRAKTLHTEIIFNLSPINNIMDALRRFGVDPECPDVIAIKVTDEPFEEVYKHLRKIVGAEAVEINDRVLEGLINVPKVKKIYKLNDAKLDEQHLQQLLTRLAIGACILRGN
ncbi:protein CGI121 [Suhomyces tanzawaensis NRRL Y-17324]|uniref:EKC/KEOPS complex subunit CGI121 n=1 Tax=Suhomyces tanzawaensis NRRL Y-17324 TaxID=984487 RepID=A0A1E4SQ62_9ASCO|nr:protein CGI121 [Suhomyces tanzawaensis NRRL Y-17324]ODV81650.1 protein CGI121 [Suhomyces tanzawaensis NRRL Y-17324]